MKNSLDQKTKSLKKTEPSQKKSFKKIYTAAIVGTGRIGFLLGFDKKREQPASHTMALNANARIKIVAGVDCNEKNLALWKKENRAAKIFSSIEKMKEEFKTAPDIIVIAVNECAHLEAALKALSFKPRLLILEKPVALNLKEAQKIKRAAKKYDVPILVNHERRFACDWNAAASYIKKIGKVQSIDARLFSGMKLYDAAAQRTGGYSLLHDGTHLVDIVLFLLEAQNFARTLLKNPVVTGIFCDEKNKKIVRNLLAHYDARFGKNLASVNFFMSGRSQFFGFEVDVVGTKGRIFIGNGFAKFYQLAESKLYSGFYSLEKDESVILPKKNGRVQTLYFANMVQNAVDFLDGKAELKSTLQTGINALRVLEEIKSKL